MTPQDRMQSATDQASDALSPFAFGLFFTAVALLVLVNRGPAPDTTATGKPPVASATRA